MKHIWTISVMLLVSVIAVGAARGTEVSKIGIVDIKRVLEDSKYREEHDQAIKRFYEEIEQQWRERQQQIEAMRRDVYLLSEGPARRKREEIAVEEERLEQFRKNAGESIRQRNLTFLQEFEKKVNALVEELAAAKGVGLVLNSAVVIYNKDAEDFTDEVLKEINELFDKEHQEGAAEAEAEGASVTFDKPAPIKDD